MDKLGFEHDRSVIDWKKEILEGLLQVLVWYLHSDVTHKII